LLGPETLLDVPDRRAASFGDLVALLWEKKALHAFFSLLLPRTDCDAPTRALAIARHDVALGHLFGRWKLLLVCPRVDDR
jgi:hypothetical protein